MTPATHVASVAQCGLTPFQDASRPPARRNPRRGIEVAKETIGTCYGEYELKPANQSIFSEKTPIFVQINSFSLI
jgi:hypothetical protein